MGSVHQQNQCACQSEREGAGKLDAEFSTQSFIAQDFIAGARLAECLLYKHKTVGWLPSSAETRCGMREVGAGR